MRRAALIIVAAACASIAAAPVRAQVSPAPAYNEVVAPAAVPAAAPTATPQILLAPATPIAAPKPPRVPLARRWWFWAGLGGAAVGVIVAGILLTPRDTYVGNAEPVGVVTIF